VPLSTNRIITAYFPQPLAPGKARSVNVFETEPTANWCPGNPQKPPIFIAGEKPGFLRERKSGISTH
jgi:hypothetical protein